MLSVNQQNFKKEVLESPVPVLVHFTTPWCGLCRAIEPLLKQLEDTYDGDIKLVKINPDENFQLVKTYSLRTLPTVIVFEDGDIMKRVEGFSRRDEFLEALNKIPVRSLASSR